MNNSRSFSRIHTAVELMILTMMLVGGCKKDEPGIVGPPSSGGGGGTLTDSLRFVALSNFNSFADSLDYNNPSAYIRILQYFRSHPETYEASDTTGPKSLWARFKDGRLFIVSDATEQPDSLGASFAAPTRVPPRQRLNQLPSSTRVRLINALGPAFEPINGTGAEGTVNTLRSWFDEAGYGSPPVGTASVDGLKLVQGDGVFYFSSHGSWGVTRIQPNGDTTAYGIWTSDEVTPADDARLSADLSSHPARLCWYRALHNNNFFGSNREVHYAITAEFVRQYMSFGMNSLVFFNACQSDAISSADFKAACRAKNAGVYLGWSNNIDGQESFKASRFLFDRLLGAHQQEPLENPSQRPFEITYVLEDMFLRHFDVHNGNHGPTNLNATPYFGYGGEPTLLAPTIAYAVPPFIQGDVNIFIDGSFGDDPGSNGIVTLGGNQLTIANWSPNRIQCPAPNSGGNVVVKVRGVKSNPLQLTEWHAQFVILFRGVQTGPNVVGTLQHRLTLNLNFLADVHNWRVLPHKPANFWGQRYFYVMPNSSCQFESSGAYRSVLDTNIIIESWSNAITPQLSHWFTEQTYFGLGGLIDSVGRQSQFNVRFRGEFTRTQNGSPAQDYFTPPSEMTQVITALTSGYVIPQGSLPFSSGEYSGTMTWTAISPQYPPDPSGGW